MPFPIKGEAEKLPPSPQSSPVKGEEDFEHPVPSGHPSTRGEKRGSNFSLLPLREKVRMRGDVFTSLLANDVNGGIYSSLDRFRKSYVASISTTFS